MSKSFWVVLFFAVITFHQSTVGQQLDVPFVATPTDVVEEMLNMAGVGPGDYVIDLGSGDGRIVIAAAKRGAIGHGIDLDPELVEESNRNAREAGVDDRISFWVENVYDTDYTMATVITMYLLTSINVNLKPDFLKKLKPGTRIVSHIFDMRNWQPDRREQVNYHNIYYWVIPANSEGKWQLDIEGKSLIMEIYQSFQEITGITLKDEISNQEWTVHEAFVTGETISVIAEEIKTSIRYVFHGLVDENEIEGTVQIHKENMRILKKWTAIRE